MLVTIWLLSILAAVYLYLRRVYSHFSRAGVNNPPPVYLLGNFARPTLRMEHFTTLMDKIYYSFPSDRFVGMYEFTNPVVFVRDPELIKQICVKDFDHFLDHRVKIDENSDPLFGRNLFSLKGQKWRDMRSTLSPAFTGSKMRHMVPFMLDCARDMSLNLKQQMQENNDTHLDLEFKDLCTRFSNDVVASCAFGLKVNSHEDKTNAFYENGKTVTNFNFIQFLKFFGFTSFPSIMNLLKVQLFDKDTSNFFRKIIQDTMKDREERKVVRPDMIHLLLEAKKGKLVHDDEKKDNDAGFATVEESSIGTSSHRRVWEEDDLIAQAILFFVAGFDTVATAMTFALYELAVNPEVQDKLIHEIDEFNRKKEKFSYNDIGEMKYLDMVISETLRKWSPGVNADRICIKTYNMGKPHPKAEKDYIVQPGQGIWIPAWSIHHDAKYFPNPNKFDPERFSNENKHNINADTYIPFGVGPRNCIGSRFALMEVKILIHQLLSQFKVAPAPRTKIPLELSTDTFTLRMTGGHWLQIQLR